MAHTGNQPTVAVPSAGLVTEVLGRAGGAVLARMFGLVAQLRGTRALHPVGVCGEGALAVEPGQPTGVALLDDHGTRACQVRWSRAAGRRRGLDIEGLAVRIGGEAGGDVLCASTGTGVVGRHVLVPRDLHQHGPLTTLLPLSTPQGGLLLRLDPVPDTGEPATAYQLFIAAPGGPWSERGRLEVTWTDRDCTRRHDPVGHPPAGSWTHPLWARLRAPSYVASRQVRADPATLDSGGVRQAQSSPPT